MPPSQRKPPKKPAAKAGSQKKPAVEAKPKQATEKKPDWEAIANARFEMMKFRVITDPNTAKMAETLGIPFNDFVMQTIKYLANPKLQPTVLMIPDEVMREVGVEPVDIKAVEQFTKEFIAANDTVVRSKFTTGDKGTAKLLGQVAGPADPNAEPAQPVSEELKKELDRARTSGKYRKF